MALNRKQYDVPTVASSTPPTAGPMIREAFSITS